jgi:bifunctional non-homologous end joining protein LigD
MHLASDSAVRRRMRDVPVTYVIFDLLYLDGHSTMSLAYEDRRDLLERMELQGPHWRTPSYHRGEGKALLEATAQLGVEGVVAKRLDSHYETGRRSSGWIKIKNVTVQDVVIGGWTPGEGGRSGHLGALAVGVMEDDRLVYAGKVGTGFTETTLRAVRKELDSRGRDDSPFEGRQPPKGTMFVDPDLVASVEFREWTKSGTLRAPSFKGLRPDKDPAEAVREPQVPARDGGDQAPGR